MKITTLPSFKKVEAEEGKKLRSINDVYSKDEETGEEHFPYYSTLLYIPKTISDEEINNSYVEE